MTIHAALVLLGLLSLPVACFSAESPAVAQESGAGALMVSAEVKSSPPLAEILTAMESMEAGQRRLRLLLAEDKRLPALTLELDAIEQVFADARLLAGKVPDDMVGFHQLTDINLSLHTAEHRLTSAINELAAKANALDTGLDRVTLASKETSKWMSTAEERNASSVLRERIQSLTPHYESLGGALLTRRDEVIEVLGWATQLRGLLNGLRVEVSERRDQVTGELRADHSDPIWRIRTHPGEHSRAWQFFNAYIAQGLRHARDQATVLLSIAGVVFALAWWLIVVTHESITALAVIDTYTRRTVSLFRTPLLAALTAALVAVSILGPPGPTSFQLLLLAFVTLPGALLARAVLGPQISLSLYTLAGVLISMALLGAVVDPLPLASRLLFILQCTLLALALGVDLRRGRIEQSLPHLPAHLVRWGCAGIVVVLIIAVLGVIIGHIGAAGIVRNLVVGALGLWLLLAVIAGLLYGFIVALLHTRAGRSLRVIRLHEHALRNSVRKSLIAVAWIAWLSGMLVMLGRADAASRFADALFHAEIRIGATTIDLSGFWLSLTVIMGTWVVVRIVPTLLEFEIVPRLSVKQGLPFAVATVTRYLLVTIGFVLAIAVMGIDLTKVTVLAGALGVGIGFGLQGVVNNFVSGLILLMERPVSVGDTVQLGPLQGTIRRIGVRSSTIQTFQGAEVIVPNADLISKEVTNWTLSDRRRRLEIDVGVAYGSEPEQVVKLLEAAAKEIAEVVAEPPPFAWCTSFGDSAIGFRLNAWIDDYDRGIANESALRMAIVRKFKDSAIEIPFPQRDIRIRMVPEASA